MGPQTSQKQLKNRLSTKAYFAAVIIALGGLGCSSKMTATVTVNSDSESTLSSSSSSTSTTDSTSTSTNAQTLASSIAISLGDQQSGVVATTLPVSLSVVVRDSSGASVSNVTISWAISSGSGTLGAPSSTTDSAGLASVSYTLGTLAEAHGITASVTGSSSLGVTFTESAIAGSATTVSLVSGDGQSSSVATALASPLVVSVKDTYGNVVSGSTVTWAVTSGGGTLSGSSSTSGTTGLASVSYTAGTAPGAKSIQATLAGTTSAITFSATTTAGSATILSISSGNDQSGALSTALSLPLTVLVQDAYNNNVSGATVNWALTSGGGSLSGASSSTNSSGLASITLTTGSSAGTQLATATIQGTSTSVTFTATANPCTGAALTNTPFASGSGTSGDPYIICTSDQFNRIGNDATYVTKAYRLGQSISMSGTPVSMIGDSTNQFNGSFDGNSNSITGVSITGTANYVGLFRYISGSAAISNLTLSLTALNANAYSNVGGMVGYASGTAISISNCRSAGTLTLTGGNYTGGFIGRFQGTGSISRSASTVTKVVAKGDAAGGFVGNINSSTASISLSYSTANVTAEMYFGAQGNYAGGFIGLAESGTISDAYALGNVNCQQNNSGGFVGHCGGATLARVFSKGTSSGSYAGGLTGTVSAAPTSGLFDSTTSGNSSGTGKALPTAALQDMATFIPYGFNFYSVWKIPSGGGYPVFQWQESANYTTVPALFSGGTGTAGDPYLISTASDLKNIMFAINQMDATAASAHYKQTGNIDLGGGTAPVIGTATTTFTGVYSGQGFTITNAVLYPAAHHVGLFGVIGSGALISGTNISYSANVSGSSYYYMGGLVGTASGTGITITESSAQGNMTLTGNRYVGGLIGHFAASGTVSKSYSTISKIVSDYQNSYTGGFVGYVNHASAVLERNYATSTMSYCGHSCGGFAGEINAGTVRNSYATGNVVGQGNRNGGFTGWSGGTIQYVYSIGAVSGSYAGGLTGYGGTASNSYWNSTTSGQATGPGGTGKTTGEMQTASTYSGWDTATIWNIADGSYPTLK